MINQDQRKSSHFDIDSDISMEMTTDRNWVYVSIYNDRNDKSVAFETSKDKLKGLVDFINSHLGHK